jgi:hypothetical protein
MSAPLSEQQLAEIQERVLEATPGPWEPYPDYGPDFYANVRGEMLLPVGSINFGDGETADADRALVGHAAEDLAVLLAEVERLRALESSIAEFVAARAEFITAIRNCPPGNSADYHRWQGHAESRRQLGETLGLPVAWPIKAGAS